jgi:thiamine biosynthesis lipoprotein
VFGTIVDITFYGDNNIQATPALQAISSDFKHLHKAWQPWGNMAIARANKLITTTEWFSYNPSIHTLLVDGKKYAVKSQGLFNPTMGRLTKLWGFNSDVMTITEPPTAITIEALLKEMPSMNDIQLNGVRIKSTNPNVFFDFGAMAKGLAVDMAITSLKEFNINNAMINAGGDIKVIGKHGDRPWHIGIRHPRKKDSILAGVDLQTNESIFTSGDYERYFIHNGMRYHHIIDPRTGYPATESMSVTVIHPNAALADAAATALFVAGPEKWHEIAQSMGIKYVLLVDAKGGIHMNPAMQKRINFIETPQHVSISKPL